MTSNINPNFPITLTPKTQSVRDNFQVAHDEISDLQAKMLPLIGGTLTGPLILAADPTVPLGASTKQYSDTTAATRVAKLGDTMTGLLTLSGPPTATLHAATKGYVDTSISSGIPAAPFLPITGGTLQGTLVVGGPAAPSDTYGGRAPSFLQVLLGQPGVATAPGILFNCYVNSAASGRYVQQGYAGGVTFSPQNGTLFLSVYPNAAAGAALVGGTSATFDQNGLFSMNALQVAQQATFTNGNVLVAAGNVTVGGAIVGTSLTQLGTINVLNRTSAILTVENPYGLSAQFMCSQNGPGATATSIRSDRLDGWCLQCRFGASTTTGGIVISDVNTTSFLTSSDHRTKRITGPADGALIDAIPTYQGEFRETQFPGLRPVVLAHELQVVAPWAVVGVKDAVDKDGHMVPQMVDFSTLVPALIAHGQNLARRVAALEALVT